ncbi:MAG: beta-ketoacyl synthase chain length factor [Rhizomicrobium sp.]
MMRFSIPAWTGWSCGPDTDGVKRLPALTRRRLTALGRNALGAASMLPALDTARYIFSSRHGEFNRTQTILHSIAAAEELSPTEFSMSVHHALTGMLSITHHNHFGHSAIAAGSESLCFALIEAAACIAENPAQPVLLLHYDDALTGEYAVFDSGAQPAILALLLQAEGENSLTFTMAEKSAAPAGTTPAARTLWQFLDGDAAQGVFYGPTHSWHWSRHGMA